MVSAASISYASDYETTSLLPAISYFCLASNSVGGIVRAYTHSDYPMIAFILFIYLSCMVLGWCLSEYQKLPPYKKSLKKTALKFAIWLIFTTTMFGFSCQFAPLFGPAAGFSFYAISGVGSALLFYLYMVFDESQGCAGGERCRGEKRKCPLSERLSEEKIRRQDSVCERV
ncbi:hypothetical protein NMG60_11006508 [Bertholletia excelsa]